MNIIMEAIFLCYSSLWDDTFVLADSLFEE